MPILLALSSAAALALQPAAAGAQPAPAPAVQPQFAQPSLNVFRRFPAADLRPMIDFYGGALGLAPLRPIQLTPNQQIILFRVGATGQIKLSAGLPADRSYHVGGATAATGIRLFTLAVPDEVALVARFATAGLPAPAFRAVGPHRIALVKDPAGFPIELVVDPAAGARGVDVGIAVSDLAASQDFYRQIAGLEELPPVQDPVLGVTRYPFRHGETTISLWQIGGGHPADTGSAGIQYVIANIDAVNAAALARHVRVETPLGGVTGFNVRTVWLNDPDGVTNYFYQLGTAAGATK